jgi:hypothetical protein
MADLPDQLTDSFGKLEPDLADSLTTALQPVADELGPRELAVLDRLVNGISGGASGAELNAFVRLLPVTVSRAVQPVIDPLTK